MGLSNETHPNQGDEESLPLYSNLDYEDATSDLPITLPAATATPDVVRDFLVRILVNNRSLPLDQARRIAARWNMGSGRELWIYNPAMYNTIFGAEDGWILYKDVKVLYYKTKQAKKGAVRRNIAPIAAVTLLIWNVSLILMGIYGGLGEGQIAATAFGVIFGGMGLIFSIIAACINHFQNFETNVESELQASFFKNAHTGPQQPIG